MGIFSIANQHIRFAVKLACAIVLALFIGFHFQLETPRWAVLTAAIVAAGPAFAAGGEPYSGCGKAGVRHCAGIIYRLPFSTGDAALGGADRRDRGGRPGICRRRGTLFRRYPLSRNVAYYRDVYWLYRRAYHYYLYDPRAVIDDSGVLCLGRFLYLDLLFSTDRKLLCVGTVRLYCADHCDYHSDGAAAHAAICA
ncbi:hypothetical protein GL480_15585 [Salmonella enterica]|nr:hypothetical protein [Salmonella enterica]